MEIKEKTMIRGIAMIDAAGCRYKIIAPDGREYGDLAVVAPKKFTRKNNFAKSTGYINSLKDMKIGDAREFAAPDGTSVVAFRAAIGGSANGFFGKGNYTTTIRDQKVQILRIS